MFIQAEVTPHHAGSIQSAQRAGKPRRYLLDHRHGPDECAAIHASWSGFAGRLRQGVTAGTCARSGHGIWWALDAADETNALAQLPRLVAERTRAIAVA